MTNAELLEFGSNDNKTFFVWALGEHWEEGKGRAGEGGTGG